MGKLFGFRLLLCLMIFVSPVHFLCAEIERPDWVQREERVILNHTLEAGENRERVVAIQIRRIRRDGAPPVILSHAVALNNKAMREIGHLLWEAGFDVWMPNMRGHGTHDELSRVKPYLPGDYGFDRIVAEDWPYLLQHVYDATGQKVSILGYSMGGMTWEQFLSGVYRVGHRVKQSNAKARERSKYVKSFIGLVVPMDLNEMNSEVKVMLESIESVVQWPYFFPLASTSETSGLLSGLMSWMRGGLFDVFARHLYNKLPWGILATDKLDDPASDFSDLVIHGLSAPHTDTIRDFLRFFHSGYKSKDQRVDYGHNKQVYVPTLMIAATSDSLAPIRQIIERGHLYPKEARMQVLVARGFAHIDVSFRRGVHGLADTLVQFLRDPMSDLPTHPELGFSLLR